MTKQLAAKTALAAVVAFLIMTVASRVFGITTGDYNKWTWPWVCTVALMGIPGCLLFDFAARKHSVAWEHLTILLGANLALAVVSTSEHRLMDLIWGFWGAGIPYSVGAVIALFGRWVFRRPPADPISV